MASYVTDVMADDVMHEMFLFVVGVEVGTMMDEYLDPEDWLLNEVEMTFLAQVLCVKWAKGFFSWFDVPMYAP